MRKIISIFLALLMVNIPFHIRAAYTNSHTLTLEAFTKNQLCDVELLDAGTITNIKITDGTGRDITDIPYTFSNSILSMELNGALSHTTIENPQKYFLDVNIEKTQTAEEGPYFMPITDYTIDGYIGTLHRDMGSYVKSGEYNQTQSMWIEITDEKLSNEFLDSIGYSNGDYSGTLTKSGNTIVSPLPDEYKYIEYKIGRAHV